MHVLWRTRPNDRLLQTYDSISPLPRATFREDHMTIRMTRYAVARLKLRQKQMILRSPNDAVLSQVVWSYQTSKF